MCDEDCDIYEPKNRKNILCKHFYGKQSDISKCHQFCTYYDSLSLMQGEDRQPLVRRRGALRRK